MVIVPQVDWIWRIVAKGHGGSSSERLARLRERSPEELLYLAHKVARVREMLKGSLTGRSGPGASSPIFVSPKFFDDQWNFKTVQPRAEAVMIGE